MTTLCILEGALVGVLIGRSDWYQRLSTRHQVLALLGAATINSAGLLLLLLLARFSP